MAKNKVSMPSSGAGITRYFDEYHSKFELQPGHVIVISILLFILIILLHQFGDSFLGLA